MDRAFQAPDNGWRPLKLSREGLDDERPLYDPEQPPAAAADPPPPAIAGVEIDDGDPDPLAPPRDGRL
jgi:hypothetical protein